MDIIPIHHILNLTPLCLDRRSSMPHRINSNMLYLIVPPHPYGA